MILIHFFSIATVAGPALITEVAGPTMPPTIAATATTAASVGNM